MPTRPALPDSAQVRRAFDRAAPTYERSAWVAREVELRMADKLQYLKVAPKRVLDAGSGAGSAHGLLRARYPVADIVELDLSLAMLRRARSQRRLGERLSALRRGPARHWVCADFARVPLRNGAVDMVWSNLALAWSPEPLATLGELHRVLAPGGALMFSFLGFTTLNIYSEVGLITLVGLVSKNGILIVQFANELQERGRDKLAAVIEASETRLRPILMTTAATVVGHFPLVLAKGPGAGARNSIGIMLVSGMIIGTVFTLFVVPSIYMLVARKHVADTADESLGTADREPVEVGA